MAIVSRIDAMIAITAGLGSRWGGLPLSFSEVTRKFQHTGPSTRAVYPQAVDNFAFLVDEGGRKGLQGCPGTSGSVSGALDGRFRTGSSLRQRSVDRRSGTWTEIVGGVRQGEHVTHMPLRGAHAGIARVHAVQDGRGV
ncbi:hypothetical protein JYK22_00200, partial [Nonomuraea sp. RK-328]|nr:hypothetical protein [Nonomuraea sp. RK-328]